MVHRRLKSMILAAPPVDISHESEKSLLDRFKTGLGSAVFPLLHLFFLEHSAFCMDDLQSAMNQVRQLKSRGVTRHFDLRRVNRQHLETSKASPST